MTRLELLQSYTDVQLKDTWKSLGSLEITANTTTYVKDMLYLVNVAGSLNGTLVFCNDTISESFNWATVQNSGEAEIYFSSNIISPYFTWILSEADLTPIAGDPITEGFIPFEDFNNQLGDVLIPEEDLDIILLDVGVPFILYDELEYSKQQIANLMIKPALEEYFKWFPKTVMEAYPLNTSNGFSIQFPTNVYQVVHVAVTQARMGGKNGSGISNPLLRYFDEMMWSASNPMLGNTSNKPSSRSLMYDWGAMLMEKASRQAIMNHGTRIHSTVIERDGVKFLDGYANKQGTLTIGWAYKSTDVADVEFARMPEFRKLCTSKVLKALGHLRIQGKLPANSDMFDYSAFIERADKLEDEVLKDWRALVKFAGIIRGSH